MQVIIGYGNNIPVVFNGYHYSDRISRLVFNSKSTRFFSEHTCHLTIIHSKTGI